MINLAISGPAFFLSASGRGQAPVSALALGNVVSF